MGEKDIEAIINTAIANAIKSELGAYKVDKEQHYQDHIWLKELREWYMGIRNATIKSIVGFVIVSLLGLLFIGFVAWGKVNFK